MGENHRVFVQDGSPIAKPEQPGLSLLTKRSIRFTRDCSPALQQTQCGASVTPKNQGFAMTGVFVGVTNVPYNKSVLERKNAK